MSKLSVRQVRTDSIALGCRKLGKQQMIFSKSITFDEEEFEGVDFSAPRSSACSPAEALFIEKLKSGDAEAFNRLVDMYGGHVYGLLLRITRDPEESSDLTQETFLRALKGIGGFRGDANLRTWLFRIAINQSRNRFRWWKRRKKHKTYSIDVPTGESETALSETLSADGLNPEENLLQEERQQLLLRAIGELSQNYKEAVVLCDIEGLSYEEIASVLDISIGTVKSRIARGRRELRSNLKDI